MSPFSAIPWGDGESLIVARTDGELSLLINGCPSKLRKDAIGRRIRDSLLLTLPEANEPEMRGIAARVLSDPDWLPSVLDDAVRMGGETRFTVDAETLQTQLSAGESEIGLDDAQIGQRIEHLTPQARTMLSTELTERSLPREGALLVWVTEIGSLRQMAKAGTWRGLAPGLQNEADLGLSAEDASGPRSVVEDLLGLAGRTYQKAPIELRDVIRRVVNNERVQALLRAARSSVTTWGKQGYAMSMTTCRRLAQHRETRRHPR